MLFNLLKKAPALATALVLSIAAPAFAQDAVADQGTMPEGAPRIAEEVFPTEAVAVAADDEVAAPEAATIETPFDGAMRQISAAQTACDEGLERLGYNPDRTKVPACVAYDAMQVALWDHAVQVQETLLAADMSGHVATRANADRMRDEALTAAATAANTLAAAVATNALAAEEARNPTADVINSVTVEGLLADLKTQVADMARDVAEGIAYDREQCANNQNLSWCPN